MGRRPGDPKLSSLRSYSCRRGSLIPVAREDFSWQLRERCLKKPTSAWSPANPAQTAAPKCIHTWKDVPGFILPLLLSFSTLHDCSRKGAWDWALLALLLLRRGKKFPFMGLWSANRFRNPGLENLGLLTAGKNCTWENESENSALSVACQSPLSTLGCFRAVVFSGEESHCCLFLHWHYQFQNHSSSFTVMLMHISPFIPQPVYVFDVLTVTTKTTEPTLLSYKYCWKIMASCRQKELFW